MNEPIVYILALCSMKAVAWRGDRELGSEPVEDACIEALIDVLIRVTSAEKKPVVK